MKYLYSKLILILIAFFSALFLHVPTTQALDFAPPPFKDLSYEGAYVGQTVADPITIEAGATKELVIKIKNTGDATWNNTGANYVSAYTVNTNYRASDFASSNWLSKSQPAKISAITKPGAVAEIKIKLTAPSKIGDYKEDFYLAAENLTWIKSSYFYLKIKVVAAGASTVQSQTTASAAAQSIVYNFTRDLELGMSGPDVKELQKYLNSNGFTIASSGAGSTGNETTLFGSLTKSALIKFQIAKKISPAVGYFGPVTRNAINKTIVASSATASETSDSTAGNSAEGENDQAVEMSKEYKANLLAFSARKVTATGGDVINFKVRYLNIGTVTWQAFAWQESGSTHEGQVALAEVAHVAIADQSWVNEKKILEKTDTIEPGEATDFDFSFRAPRYKGEYIARFQLTANSYTLDGGTLELPVTVTADAPINYTEPVFANITNRQLIAEPNIRVGLYKTDATVKFKSPFSYQAYTGGIFKGEIPANEQVELKYLDGIYTFTGPSLSFNTREPIRMIPRQNGSHFILVNYDRHVSWKGSLNFNAYRGVMEYKFSNKSNMPWVINELPLDEYVAGIGETSNGAAMEYIKAILTAARTYAYYHLNNGVPADQRTYDVVATTADQLYLGYNSEVLMPRVVQAARSTYGEMVTYKGTPVVTPYFGHSDGKTRLWSQVWGGVDKPWIQPVVCKYDIGRSMWGHGVGMSAADAAQRADKDGWTYDQLLKYYYTGVDVERIY